MKNRFFFLHKKIKPGTLIKLGFPVGIFTTEENANDYGFGFHWKIPANIGSYKFKETFAIVLEKCMIKKENKADYYLLRILCTETSGWVQINDSTSISLISLSFCKQSISKP